MQAHAAAFLGMACSGYAWQWLACE